MSTQFTCPECGAHEWGSAIEGDSVVRKYCHGGMGCRFEWPPGDDIKHFRLNGSEMTPAEIHMNGLGD